MYTIIGLGSAGCNIAEMFEKQDGFKVKLIDSGIEGENCFSLEKCDTPEQYEQHTPDLTSFFSDVEGKVLLIVGGSGKISGASLKILKYVNNKEINVLYIRPDRSLLFETGILQERLTFNVFQEYARSGIFKYVYLVDNTAIENVLGDIPIVGYYEKLNEIIYQSFNNIYNFDTSTPVIDNSFPPKEISRIVTFGFYDLDNNQEKLLYPLDFIDDKVYNFVINESELKSNGKLFKLLKERMKEKSINNTKISYKIYSSAVEQNYCYVVAYSRKIQE
jgi:hypothetical protein